MESNFEVSRRGFLKGSAFLGASIGGLAALSGCAPTAQQTTSSPNENDALAQTGNEEEASFDYESMTGKSEAAGNSYTFKYLGTAGTIGTLEIKNRIVKSASSGAEAPFDVESNEFTPEAIEFYRNLAKGGTGLIIHDTVGFKDGATSPAPFRTEADIPVHTPYIEAVHNEGAAIFLQLFSADNADAERYTGVPSDPHGSSTFAQKGADQGMNEKPPTMWSTEEVEEQIAQWVNGVHLAMKAGFDGVEINAGSNHIGANFISRFWNRERTDKYGADSIENLGRFVTEILDGARALCGNDFPIGVLINGHEWDMFSDGNDERCNSTALQCELAKLFVEHGADYIHVRSSAWGAHMLDIFPDVAFIHDEPDTGYGHRLDIATRWPEFIQDYRGAGAFIDTAAVIRSAVNVPVITTGMMDVRLIPDVIDEAIGEGKIDFIGMTRRMYADPDYAAKALAGNLSEIRPCANCISCWHDHCRVNPGLVRAGGAEMPEGYQVTPTEVPKKVLIAGGGPAGLEAAHIAAERGHSVVLCEKTESWGGLTKTAVAYKGLNEKIDDHISWLVNQCEKFGVELVLGEEVSEDTLAAYLPDVLIDATGGAITVPDIKGIDSPKVSYMGDGSLVDGDRIVVIGGGIEAIEVAIFLRKQGKQITLLNENPSEELGQNIPPELHPKYLRWCQTHYVTTYSDVTIDAITDEGVEFTYDYGLPDIIECDNIVVALPMSTDTSLKSALESKVSEAYAIGNANEYGLIREAVRDGNLLARTL